MIAIFVQTIPSGAEVLEQEIQKNLSMKLNYYTISMDTDL